ncbi:RDD family protein [Specibacter sp. NPDC057265]|uniref:RDD family protein n=1 Tax=Specibacter sp. NPDC057265 TaxID=3346075 RepID=UPI003632B9B5
MAQKVADPCRNCGAELAPGAPFCTLCGTAMSNRAASPAPSSVPVGAPAGAAADAGGKAAVPGIIAVGAGPLAPLVPPRQLGVDPRLAEATALVPGGAGRRLSAWLIDAAVPGILLGIASAVGVALIDVRRVGSQNVVDFTWLGILLGIASVLSLGWVVFQWLWEAKKGKTLGNLLLGLRTTNMDGHPAGVLAIFLRLLIVSVSSIVPTIGPLLVVLSNAWDGNAKKQGWHDKVAHTLVFNVRTGRDPLETGGIAERENYTPAPVQAISPVAAPMVRPGQETAAVPSATMPAPSDTVGAGSRRRKKAPAADPFAPIQFHGQSGQSAQPAPGQSAPYGGTFAPPSPVPAQPAQFAESGPITSVPGITAPPPPRDVAASAQADDDAGETRVRPVAAATPTYRLVFDDGRHEDVSALALIGRNPAGYDGEMISRLISVHDTSRSVSKTHLHVRVSSEGVWVTDRNSTNGSAIATAAGARTTLVGGTPALAEVGARVHFGDRSFVVAKA